MNTPRSFGGSARRPHNQPEAQGHLGRKASPCCSKRLNAPSLHTERPSRRSTTSTSPDRPHTNVGGDPYARRDDPASAYHEETLNQRLNEAGTGMRTRKLLTVD